MSCCGQKRAEQKRQPGPAGTPAPVTSQRGSQPGQPSGLARPGDPRAGGAARLNYLTRNGKLFAR
jgi:hypothetical protein